MYIVYKMYMYLHNLGSLFSCVDASDILYYPPHCVHGYEAALLEAGLQAQEVDTITTRKRGEGEGLQLYRISCANTPLSIMVCSGSSHACTLYTVHCSVSIHATYKMYSLVPRLSYIVLTFELARAKSTAERLKVNIIYAMWGQSGNEATKCMHSEHCTRHSLLTLHGL